MRRRHRWIMVANALLPPCALHAQAEVTSWIRANAVPLTTVEARHGFDDMEPLRRIVGDARIVSLGEATHGTREFFQLKHRMLEFLATKIGFTIFSIEANMPEAYRLNEYVLNGTGDPVQLLRGMYFWTWNTEEVLDMIHWMREFNASGKGRVQFTGFDMQTTSVASEIVRAYVQRVDPSYEPVVRQAIALTARPTEVTQPAFGLLVGGLPVAAFAGKTVRFSGYMKTAGIDSGYAGLWWRADGPDGSPAAFNNMNMTGPRGTTDWQRYELELTMPPDIRNINFGALHPGYGTAWFSDLSVEVDGKKYETPALDLTLSSSTMGGFGTNGAGYSIGLDPSVVHNGHPTLRMDRPHGVTATPAATNAVSASTVLAAWRAIYDTLRTSSDTSAAARWATQNARVVVQAMQSKTGGQSRDQSMAENVRWILDENPKAKIVLWAHNGHVATASSYKPMGAFLREMYGSQMVVLGFAFNRGSFQAVGQSAGRSTSLQRHTVSAANAGTFDATLATAGLPIFALDLRHPAAGAATSWVETAQQTRWVGAVFNASIPAMYMGTITPRKTFDAIFFVDSTTAAHGLSMR
jgi:erythromycin esterase-like protein